MTRQAKIDAAGLLIEHGFCDYGAEGLAVPDDFALEPGRWRFDGARWITVVPPRPQRELHREALLAQCEALGADASIPPKLQAFMVALRKVL